MSWFLQASRFFTFIFMYSLAQKIVSFLIFNIKQNFFNEIVTKPQIKTVALINIDQLNCQAR